jgi:hypothetical protein
VGYAFMPRPRAAAAAHVGPQQLTGIRGSLLDVDSCDLLRLLAGQPGDLGKRGAVLRQRIHIVFDGFAVDLDRERMTSWSVQLDGEGGAGGPDERQIGSGASWPARSSSSQAARCRGWWMKAAGAVAIAGILFFAVNHQE